MTRAEVERLKAELNEARAREQRLREALEASHQPIYWSAGQPRRERRSRRSAGSRSEQEERA